MGETSLQHREGEQEDNYSLAFYCSYIMLLWIFSTPAVAPSLFSAEVWIPHHAGVWDMWQDITGWLLFTSMTIEGQVDPCLQILSVHEARDTIQFSFPSFLEPGKSLTLKLGS